MAYNENIPAANDLLSQSQADIQQNFAALKTFLETNHEAFADASEGKHKHVTFPEQGADVSTAANEKVIYAKESALTNVSELFIRNESDGTVTEFTSSGQATTGWTRLPSGILIKWGTGSVNANSSATATFDTTVAFSAIYTVSVSRQGQSGDSGAMYYQAYTTTNVTVYNASNNGPRAFTYFAIGI